MGCDTNEVSVGQWASTSPVTEQANRAGDNWAKLCGCRGHYHTINYHEITDKWCAEHSPFKGMGAEKPIRQYETGATRDTDSNKLKYEGFISPLVEKRFAEYMHLHRKQSDGSMRAPDNWQKGIPLDDYVDSLVRHVQDLRLHHDGFASAATDKDLESVLCAIRFNVDGYLFELLKNRVVK